MTKSIFTQCTVLLVRRKTKCSNGYLRILKLEETIIVVAFSLTKEDSTRSRVVKDFIAIPIAILGCLLNSSKVFPMHFAVENSSVAHIKYKHGGCTHRGRHPEIFTFISTHQNLAIFIKTNELCVNFSLCPF